MKCEFDDFYLNSQPKFRGTYYLRFNSTYVSIFSLASVEDHPVTNGYVNGEANGEMNGHAVNGDDSHTQEINGHDANGHANDEEEEKENKRESVSFH